MPLIDREDSLVLVIDAQENFYGTSPFDEPVGVDFEKFESFLDCAAWVVSVAAALSIPILATEEDAARCGPTAARIAKEWPPSTPVFDKRVFGAAADGPIRDAVLNSGCGTVVLVGLETDVCVSHSAIGFMDLGKRVVIVEDALYTRGVGHGAGLRRMQGAGAVILTARQLWYEWARTLATAIEYSERLPAAPGFHL